jgi:uncharacterized protein (TIGR03086 family)
VDLLSSYTDAVRRNHDRVDAVHPGRLGDPTPCTEWDVEALIGHLTGGYQMFVAALGHPGPADGTPADTAGQHRAAGEAAIAAFAAPGALDRTLRLPVGDVPGHVALALALTDAVVHGWDLATATGQDTTIDEQVAAVLLAGAEQMVGPQMRQPDGTMPVFAPPVAVDPQQPAADRLIAFLGRKP